MASKLIKLQKIKQNKQLKKKEEAQGPSKAMQI